MTGALPSLQPRLALGFLLAVCVALSSTGCVTASRATVAAPLASEPVAPPAPEPEPTPVVAKAEKPKASTKRAPARPAPEVKTHEVKTPEGKMPVAARAPELKRPQSGGAMASEPVPFEPSMTRPQLLSGREPRLTEEARAARVRGTALVRCVVTREGQVRGCRILNGLPHMEQELLDAVSSWRVTPATAGGQPLDVDYTFVVRIPTG